MLNLCYEYNRPDMNGLLRRCCSVICTLFFFSVACVADGVEVGERWVEIAFSKLTNDDVFVIVDVTSSCAMKNTKTTSNPKGQTVELSADGGCILSSVTADMQWRIRKSGSNVYIGRYGASADDGVLHNVSGTTLRVDYTADNSARSLTWDAAASTLRFTGNSRYIEYSEYGDWRAYSYKATQTSMKFYRKETAEFTAVNISAAGYGTFYTDRSFVMPQGLEGAVVKGLHEGSRLVIDYCYAPGDVVPAETGLLLRGAPGSYQAFYTEAVPKAVASGNYLKGSVVSAMTTGENCDFYKLSYDSNNAGELGFYYGAEDGAPFMNGAYKAYLALPKTLGAPLLGFSLDGSVSTGVGQLPVADVPAAVYDLSGRRLSGASSQSLGRGVYVIGGKKVIVK